MEQIPGCAGGAPPLSGRVGQGLLCKQRYESEAAVGRTQAAKVDDSFAPEISQQEVHLRNRRRVLLRAKC